jgi:hypothetical protein
VSFATRINADRQAIEDAIAALPPEADGTYLYRQLEQLPSSGNGGGTATDANATSIGNVAHADALALALKLDAIAANTNADKFEYVQLEDVIDPNTSVTFYQRIDKVAGTVTALTLSLTPYTIAGTVKLATPSQGKTAIATVFEAITTNGANWTIGQPLRRVESWILGSTNTLVASTWINDDTGAVLTVTPVIGTDVRIEEDLTLDTLRMIDNAIGTSNDPVATSDTGNFSAIALLKRLSAKLPGLGSKTTANSTSITIASDDIAIGNLGTSTTQPAGGVGLLGAIGGAYQQAKDLLALLNSATAGGFMRPSTGAEFTATQPIATELNATIAPLTNSSIVKAQLQDNTGTAIVLGQAIAAASMPVVLPAAQISSLSPAPGGLLPTVDIANSAITTTATTPAISITTATSHQFEVLVPTVTGTTPTLDILVQESLDNINWRTIYRFERITVAGSYRSIALPNSALFIRYVQTIGGTTPSFTRSISRYSSNSPAPVPTHSRRVGGYSGAPGFVIQDVPIWGRVRRLTVNNRTPSLFFLQIHDKATALATGNVPLTGEVYPVAINSSLPFTVADFSEFGTQIADNPRIGLSSTFATYTAAAIAAGQASLFAEVL